MRTTFTRARFTCLAALALAACDVHVVGDADSARAADSAAARAARAAAAPGSTTAAPAAPTGGDTTTAAVAGALQGDTAADSAESLDAHADDRPAAGDSSGPPVASRPVADSVRIDVDVAARRLQLVRGDRPVATYRVAVGTKEWPTETGEWAIKQVIINPEWIPPDQSWADENVPKKPGDPHNPLGRAQLVYDPPRTIHGTDKPSTIGKAASHGSIRMTNADVVRLATQVLALSGSGKDDAWVKNALAKRTEKQVVDLPTLVPIRVH